MIINLCSKYSLAISNSQEGIAKDLPMLQVKSPLDHKNKHSEGKIPVAKASPFLQG